MFTKRFKLFNLFGFPIHIDLSWFIIAVVLAWSLAMAFNQRYEGLSQGTIWTMGVIGAIGLFVSVVLHELGHALVARRYNIEMKGITLFIFGGVAEMTDEPPSPKAEFFVAIGGPIVSIALAVIFFLAALLVPTGAELKQDPLVMDVTNPAAAAVHGVIGYLWTINFILVLFNMVPAFPLDGGRVLRAILWKTKDSLRDATRITSQIGSGFGLMLIGLGVFLLVAGGNFVALIWFGLLGMFLRGAAQMSYQQLQIRQALEGEHVRDFMNDQPVTVTPETSIKTLVEDYVYRHHHKMFPVTEDDRLVGCVTTRQIKEIPKEEWEEKTVSELMDECDDRNVIQQDADATAALSRMNRQKASRLMVVEDGRLVGVLSLKDLLSFLSLKIDLEGEGELAPAAARQTREPDTAAQPRPA